MIYREAIRFLYDLRLFGAKLGLENTFKLAALAGNPHHHLRFIHVAGTNGKGSTCAMLESIYRAAGLRVGLFTSPHLVSFAERIQVNRQLIPEDEVVRLVGEMQELLKQFPAAAHPTFFEVVTVMALRYFAEQKCDLVIWETGLGGRLDATNIVTPLASVITNVAFDHQQWLGDTLEKIAFEKAGIIKPGVPVITAAWRGEGLEVIADVARQRQAPLVVVEPCDTNHPPLDTIELPLIGQHQRMNAVVSVAAVRALAKQLPVSDAHIRTGLSRVDWPGRLQRVETSAGQTIVFDGAHNPASIEALCAALQKEFPNARPTAIFGVLADKDWKTMAAQLARLAGRLLLVAVNSERSLAPEIMLPVCRDAQPGTRVAVCSSLSEALAQTAGDPFVVITGSLYLVGEAMERLRLLPAPNTDERGLNEWTAQRSAAVLSASGCAQPPVH